MNKHTKQYMLAGLAVMAIIVTVVSYKSDGTVVTSSANKTPATTSAATATKAFDKTKYSTSSADSLWVVVNKQRPLQPTNYVPPQLVDTGLPTRTAGIQVSATMQPALKKLFAAATANGTPLRVSSGYRSYVYQVGLHDTYVKTQGQAVADSESARPGYSEHQTGLAADLGALSGDCEVQVCFAATPAGKWLAANAYKYGFIIRYQDGLTPITGYAYEPWHVRYIGTELATELHNTNTLTLEQFFGLPNAPNY